MRALATAIRSGDAWSLRSATYPGELVDLLDLASGRHRVVELGTGTAWTAIALALADERRQVVSYDPYPPPGRERYLNLVAADVRARIELEDEPGEDGPPAGLTPDFLFVDDGHEPRQVIANFAAWQPALEPSGVVVFHDYENPAWPGVSEAISELGLEGESIGFLFVWRKPPG